MAYHVKKGPADPFRGDWYIQESSFPSSEEAVASALRLTYQNFAELGNSWDQYGYEWSVFEESLNAEKKIWEGYKAISIMREKNKVQPESEFGWMHL
jgi:hypothetical protein